MSSKRAHSEDDLHSVDRYSDDFSSDDNKRTPVPNKVTNQRQNSDQRHYQDKLHGRGRRSGSTRGSLQQQGVRKGRRSSRASEPIDMKKSHDNVTTRVLSASRNRINELRNKVEELKLRIRDLEQENRLYKNLQFRHEKTIRTFEDKENDLPMILDKHNNEIRTLKELNRQLKEKFDKSNRYLRDAEDELERVKRKMNKYKGMCEEKDLIERDELSRRLAKVEQEMEDKDLKIKELQKHLDVLKKNHKHELGIEVARQKDLKKRVEELNEMNSQLGNQLKEKEKALEHQNIHSNLRQGRSSRTTSPDSQQPRMSKKVTPSTTELTPRDKARFYAEKQRVDVLKQKEMKEGRKKLQKLEAEKLSRPNSPQEFSFETHNREGLEGIEEKTWMEEDKLRQEKIKLEKDDLQRKQKELQKRHEDGGKHLREEERKQHKELQGLESKKNEMEEMDRKNSKEIREIFEKEKAEQERRLQLEREKIANDPAVQAERKKKDELLKKLHALDDKSNIPISKNSSLNHSQTNGSGVISDSQKMVGESFVDKASKHQHLNKLKHDDISVPHHDHQKNKCQTLDNDIGGYQPSFGPTRGSTNKITKPKTVYDDDEPAFKITSNSSLNVTTKQQNEKKPNLLESLFGHQASSSKNLPTQENDTFFLTNKSSVSNNQTKSGFPWDANSGPAKPSNHISNSDKKATTFAGGGSALTNSDISENTAKVYKHQQNLNTFSAKPSVTAIDKLDDEIEEFVL